MSRVLCGIFVGFVGLIQVGWGQNSYYTPQVITGDLGNGQFWSTTFVFLNPSTTQTITVTIQLMTTDGQPLNRFPVQAVFHGHAHHGRYEGHTPRGAPVYNVAFSVEKSTGRPYALIKV